MSRNFAVDGTCSDRSIQHFEVHIARTILNACITFRNKALANFNKSLHKRDRASK